MRRIILLAIVVIGSFSCDSNNPKAIGIDREKTEDNPELQKMFEADQEDRTSHKLDSKGINYNDSLREARVYELLNSNKVRTANDYNNAALIFHHGEDSIAYGMAVKLMTKSIELEPSRDKWLLAVATDRYLLSRNMPQIYGTHFKRMDDKTVVREKMDSTKVSDAERIEYGVETLAEQRMKISRLNKKRIQELLDKGMSINDLVQFIRSEDIVSSEYDLSENVIGRLGYQLMMQDKVVEAEEVLSLNTKLYPNSYNAFDTYGECLLLLGETENAIIAYRKSLELNPDNNNAKKILNKIQK